ncbi:MAG: hypothetical protein V3U56_05855, partial [Syntrophobacteria bacterium]
GCYSNVCRGRRQKATQDGLIPCILESDEHSRSCRKNRAKLIQKIYDVDPLTCSKCQGQMRIISFIEDQEVIKTILKHLGLWLVTRKPEPRANAPPENFRSIIPMHKSRPLPNTFTATLNTLWMCAYPDFKPRGGVRALVYRDLGLPTQSRPLPHTSNSIRIAFTSLSVKIVVPTFGFAWLTAQRFSCAATRLRR